MKTTFRLLLAAALVVLVLLPGTGSASAPGRDVDHSATGEGSANALPDDADGDGVLDDGDNCPDWPNAAQGLPSWSLAGDDLDCDGFSGELESYLGTSSTGFCPATTTPGDEPTDPWPTDFNDNGMTNLPDVISFGPTFNKLEGQLGYDQRHDLNNTQQVLLSDVILMGPFFNKDCLPPPPSSEFLIGKALSDGEITYEDSLRYRAYALYQTPDLPAEFASPVIDYHAGGELFKEVYLNQGALSAQLLADLAPFEARPPDPVSVFANPPQAAGSLAAAVAPAWVSETAAGGKARVWVKDGPLAEVEKVFYAATVTDTWTTLQTIFPFTSTDTPGAAGVNPDNAIDIYFANFGDVDPRRTSCPTPPCTGFRAPGGAITRAAAPFAGTTSSAYVIVDAAVSGNGLINLVAHELMHVGQFKYTIDEGNWLEDATAQWGAERVLIEQGLRQVSDYDYLPEFFDGLNLRLTRDVDLNRYGSWLFFLSASMNHGDGIVTSIWQQAAAPGVQDGDAVDLILPWVDYFDDFTVQNWNKAPIDPLYKGPKPASPLFPDGLKPDLWKTKKFTTTFEEINNDRPRELAARYYRYVFEPNIRKAEFFNDTVANQDAHIWAIKKIGGQWKPPEDWSRNEKQRFCRDFPEQDLQELIIVLSNSHKTTNLPAGNKYRVKADTESCKGFIGTATATYHQAFSQGEYTEDWTVTANILWEEDEDYFFGCGCRPFFPTGEIDWEWNFSYPEPPCNDTDSGTLEAGTGLTHPGEQMLILWEDGADLTQYFYSATGQVPGTWFSDCEGGDRCCLTFMDIPPPDVIFVTPTLPPTMPPIPPSAPLLAPVSVAAPVPGSELSAATTTVFCPESEFSFPRDANAFSGSCFAGYAAEPNDYLRYDWSFTRIGGVP